MKKPSNLKDYKNALRVKLKKKRASMSKKEKDQLDMQIFHRVVATSAYKEAKVLLLYVSTSIEVDTIQLIHRCFEDGKTVAVPRCIAGTRNMEFYKITSLNDLETGAFGVMEPKEIPQTKLNDFGNAICIVPAMGCDHQGYRLGYGGGYYDRFLENFIAPKIVLIYHNCYLDRLWHGKYDISCDVIVTNKFVRHPPKIPKPKI